MSAIEGLWDMYERQLALVHVSNIPTSRGLSVPLVRVGVTPVSPYWNLYHVPLFKPTLLPFTQLSPNKQKGPQT